MCLGLLFGPLPLRFFFLQVLVVGGGVAGLSAAFELAERGYKVVFLKITNLPKPRQVSICPKYTLNVTGI